MTVAKWTETDSKSAEKVWLDYQQHHDVSAKVGQTAGIEPVSGCIWFGDSIQDVVAQRDAEGKSTRCFSCESGLTPTIEREGIVDRRQHHGNWCAGNQHPSRRPTLARDRRYGFQRRIGTAGTSTRGREPAVCRAVMTSSSVHDCSVTIGLRSISLLNTHREKLGHRIGSRLSVG